MRRAPPLSAAQAAAVQQDACAAAEAALHYRAEWRKRVREGEIVPPVKRARSVAPEPWVPLARVSASSVPSAASDDALAARLAHARARAEAAAVRRVREAHESACVSLRAAEPCVAEGTAAALQLLGPRHGSYSAALCPPPAVEYLAGLTGAQAGVLRAVACGGGVFVTGPAGSGKSRTIVALVRWLRALDVVTAVTALTAKAATGITEELLRASRTEEATGGALAAAVDVMDGSEADAADSALDAAAAGLHGATPGTRAALLESLVAPRTLHSYAGITPMARLDNAARYAVRALERDEEHGKGELHARLVGTAVLIVDEVSMASADLVAAVDALARRARGCAAVPFGGMTVVVFGDMLQQPPVVLTRGPGVSSAGCAQLIIENARFSDWFPRTLLLRAVHRQATARDVRILNAMRIGEALAPADFAFLATLVVPEAPADGSVTVIVPLRRQVAEENARRRAVLSCSAPILAQPVRVALCHAGWKMRSIRKEAAAFAFEDVDALRGEVSPHGRAVARLRANSPRTALSQDAARVIMDANVPHAEALLGCWPSIAINSLADMVRDGRALPNDRLLVVGLPVLLTATLCAARGIVAGRLGTVVGFLPLGRPTLEEVRAGVREALTRAARTRFLAAIRADGIARTIAQATGSAPRPSFADVVQAAFKELVRLACDAAGGVPDSAGAPIVALEGELPFVVPSVCNVSDALRERLPSVEWAARRAVDKGAARRAARRGAEHEPSLLTPQERYFVAAQVTPLIPAAALTVHRVEGMTLDGNVAVVMDGAFEVGAEYVAFSRARALERVRIVGAFRPNAVKAHAAGVLFYRALDNAADAAGAACTKTVCLRMAGELAAMARRGEPRYFMNVQCRARALSAAEQTSDADECGDSEC